jgi:hypothetical protein
MGLGRTRGLRAADRVIGRQFTSANMALSKICSAYRLLEAGFASVPHAADLHHPPALERDDGVGARTVDSRCAMTKEVRFRIRFASASCTSSSDSASSEEVASSGSGSASP